MSQRNKIELAIQKELSKLLEPENYVFIKKDGLFAKNVNEEVEWAFHFYLTDRKVYSVFARAGVIYKKLTSIIHKLLANTGMSLPNVAVSTQMGKGKEEIRISSLDEIDFFVNRFYEMLKDTEHQFLLPYTNVLTAIDGFKMRRAAQWPGDLQQCVCHLVAYGIEMEDKDIISLGINKWQEKSKDKAYYIGNNEFYTALNEALKENGYIR